MVNSQSKVSDLTVADLETILLRVRASDPTSGTETLLDTRQASAFLGGTSQAALYYRCAHNKIPHIRQAGCLYFFKDVLSHWKCQNGFAQSIAPSQTDQL
jgi:hypothetical protein